MVSVAGFGWERALRASSRGWRSRLPSGSWSLSRLPPVDLQRARRHQGGSAPARRRGRVARRFTAAPSRRGRSRRSYGANSAARTRIPLVGWWTNRTAPTSLPPSQPLVDHAVLWQAQRRRRSGPPQPMSIMQKSERGASCGLGGDGQLRGWPVGWPCRSPPKARPVRRSCPGWLASSSTSCSNPRFSTRRDRPSPRRCPAWASTASPTSGRASASSSSSTAR